MNAHQYIEKKFGIKVGTRSPIEISRMGRNELARMFKALEFTKGAEIGTWNAKYTKVLCENNPDLKLFGVDLNSKTNKKDVPNNCVLVRMNSLNAAKKFVDESLDFVYLDGDHDFANATLDLYEWSKKVKPGGIIAGHDYIRYRAQANSHTYEAVNAYTNAYRITPWFVIGRKTDPVRSWFWMKPLA